MAEKTMRVKVMIWSRRGVTAVSKQQNHLKSILRFPTCKPPDDAVQNRKAGPKQQQAPLPPQFRALVSLSMYCGSEGVGESSGSPPSSSDGPPSSGPMNDNRDNRGIRNNSVGGGRYNSMLPNVSGGSGNGTNNRSHGPNYSPKQSCGKYRDEAVADIADKCNLQSCPPGRNVTSTRITTIIGGAFFHGAGDCRSAAHHGPSVNHHSPRKIATPASERKKMECKQGAARKLQELEQQQELNNATRFAGCGIEPGVSLKMVQEQLVATESVLRELGFQVLKTKMPKAALAIRRKAPSTTQAGGGGQILQRNQVYPPLQAAEGGTCGQDVYRFDCPQAERRFTEKGISDRFLSIAEISAIRRLQNSPRSWNGTGLFEIKKMDDEYFCFATERTNPKACQSRHHLLRGAFKDNFNETERLPKLVNRTTKKANSDPSRRGEGTCRQLLCAHQHRIAPGFLASPGWDRP
ncbi:hypothetical protein pipiens_006565 [Culex pipiens pipiens]|uniref:Uncharacterized protein n=1 Tax=Culex pipiens pipiens TaxID=38569 RepID=A0ABD1DNZ1_CULPP